MLAEAETFLGRPHGELAVQALRAQQARSQRDAELAITPGPLAPLPPTYGPRACQADAPHLRLQFHLQFSAANAKLQMCR